VQGAGGFGQVFECMWRGQRVAVKQLPTVLEDGHGAPPPRAQYLALIAEIQLSCRFKCDRLVRHLEVLRWTRACHFRLSRPLSKSQPLPSACVGPKRLW